MYRSKLLKLAAIVSLPAFSLVNTAQATTYDAATDWATTYSTSASVATSSTSTWGAGGAWSAGVLSSNWTNMKNLTTSPNANQTALTYWNPLTGTGGNITSGSNGSTVASTTGAYTVPFQFYAATPGVTQAVNVGLTVTGQIAAAQPAELNSTKITLASGVTSNGAGSGTLNFVQHTEDALGSTSIEGFSNTAQSKSFNDGSGTETGVETGIFYNYSASSIKQGNDVVPSSAATDTLAVFGIYGPEVIAWTAPSAGTITINTTAYDTGEESGGSGFYVLSQLAGVTTAPTVLMDALNVRVSGTSYEPSSTGSVNGGDVYYAGSSGGVAGQANGVYSINGSTPTVTSAVAGNFWAGGSTQPYDWESVHWVSGTISVAAGQTIYFASDPAHNQNLSNGNHMFGAATDPAQISAQITFAPEPSSVVLLGIAGVGLALAAWKRRRLAA